MSQTEYERLLARRDELSLEYGKFLEETGGRERFFHWTSKQIKLFASMCNEADEIEARLKKLRSTLSLKG